MATVFDEYEEQPKKRTKFIMVLCILTFVGSGFSICMNTYSYFTATKSAQEFRNMNRMIENDPAFKEERTYKNEEDSLKKAKSEKLAKKMIGTFQSSFTEDNIKKNALGGLLAGILCISGALLMWRINKKGYFLYLAGTILGIAVPIMLYGNNFVGIGGAIVTGFFGLVFCILYGVNLKDMK